MLGLGPSTRVDAGRALELQRGGAVLLDVRERSEWVAGRAPRARHVPLGELDRRRRELPTGTTIVAICRSGVRSAQAARLLRRAGVNAIDVRGGMRAWQAAGLPVVAAGGRDGRVR
jgi:rhodanese-related sulfurtransferase